MIIYLKEWLNDPDAPPLTANHRTGMLQFYGIKEDERIGLEHIMVLMFYTDFDENSRIFSSTYRKISEYESNESLKARHSEVYYWGRYLRELVECFGEVMEDSEIPLFYHGVSCELLFDSTHILLCGPVSTTTGLVYVFIFYVFFCIYFYTNRFHYCLEYFWQ